MTLLADDPAACRVCGCTEDRACEGGCCWVPDPLMLGELCSACAIRPCVGGLDLSIACTGVAHWADRRVESWPLNSDDGDRRLPEIRARIYDYLEDAFGSCAAELVVIEDLPFNANAAGVTGMVHGLARTELLVRNIPYLLVTPSSLKVYATGKGGATKADMRVELLKRTGVDLRDDNQCDAWWLRAIGLDLFGEPILDLPKDHRRALDKLVLPAGVAA